MTARALARRPDDRPLRLPSPAAAWPPAFDIATVARQVAFRAIKDRARAMRRDRGRMAAVHPALPHADWPAALPLAIGAYREALARPQRWGGFGGESVAMNARAAWVLARADRRFGRLG